MLDVRCFAGIATTLAAIFALAQPVSAVQLANVSVKDIFARPINTIGIKLVDWDGYLANPAIKFTVTVPSGAVMPASATLTANHQRLYFNTPSSAGANGPSKTIQFTSTIKEIPVYISIFPDRDGLDEDYTLTIRLTDKNGSQSTTLVPIHVIDQDLATTPNFNLSVDFSTDQSGFFQDTVKRTIVQQAADDWAYFIDGTGLNQIPPRSESTWIWGPNGWAPGSVGFTVTNSSAYTGFLLYAYGIHMTELRSGGEGSGGGGYQQIGSTTLPLRRSGGLEVETQGNYNTLGWYLTTSDNDWWVSANYNEPNDLYSIARHEIGHSLAFCSAYPRSASAQSLGYFDNPAIVSYFGATLPIDTAYHFSGAIDPSSKRGAFGSEYNGTMVQRRWLLTKLDLLALQAAGYTLRNTSALVPLSLTAQPPSTGTTGKPYSEQLQATGGIPSYAWDITSGTLPPGLTLDSYTGLISGTPVQMGSFNFTVRVRDYSPGGSSSTENLTIDIHPDTVPPVITSATLTPSMVAVGDLVNVTVVATDDVSVATVKVDNVLLIKSGATWQGSIPASTDLGLHGVTITASDSSNNTTSSSLYYRTARALGLSNASAKYALTTPAREQFLFMTWGKVIESNTNSLRIDDGSMCPITITAPNHAFKLNDWIRTRGVLSLGPDGPILISTPNLITVIK